MPRGGVCRLALTDVDRQGRDLFVRWAREAGYTVDIDQMGNIIGMTIGQELDRIGYAGTRPCGGQPVHAYFEAHIEQGPILEAEKRLIGVVQGIQGLRWFDCTIHGLESHAGTTPIPTRRDALLGAAGVIQAVREAADAQAPYGRGTVGQLLVHPNSRNVIPGRVDFTIDLRHPEDGPLLAMTHHIRTAVDRVCAEMNLHGELHEIWYAPPTAFTAECIDAVCHAAQRLDFPHMNMISGAGHDAKYLAQVCPTAMIFIPCKDGISHNETEDATKDDVAAGCNVLLQALLEKAVG